MIIKIHEYTQYYNIKLLHLKHCNYDMFRPYLVARPEGAYISICIKCRL